MNKKKEKQKGAIIIEATIALTTFMFAIVTVLFVSKICYTQAKMGTFIDGVAKDLSEFSYIYSLTGLADKHSKLSAGASQATKEMDDVVDNLDNVFTALSELADLGSSLINDEGMQNSMLDFLKNEGANKIESLITAQIVRAFAEKRLAGVNGVNCETVLKRYGIKNTRGSYLDSIDFDDSVFCVNGSAEIKVVARYTVKLITLLNVDIDYNIVQCAATKAWAAAKKADSEVVKEEETTKENTSQEETTTQEPLKTSDEYAQDALKNPGNPQIILGENSKSLAELYHTSYFELDNYDEILSRTDADFMREIREKFLQQQLDQGKEFLFSEDPNTATGDVGEAASWLLSHGYHFVLDATGLWRAEPN